MTQENISEVVVSEPRQEISMIRDVFREEYEKGRADVLQYITSWTKEELDIIEMIIYDVERWKEYYEDNNASTCAKECQIELDFLEKLKFIKFYKKLLN